MFANTLPPFSTKIDHRGEIALYRSHDLVPYPQALEWMEARAAQIIDHQADEALWFLEHPPLYTAGTSAKAQDLLQPDRFPVYQTGRGGEYTYHGPGQRVVYVMLDLRTRGRDVRAFVRQLERWVIDVLDGFGVQGSIREGRVGVWVETAPDFLGRTSEAKIAAIGIRLRKWVSFHGIAINVAPDLEHFTGIVPCGITQFGVTSLEHLDKLQALEPRDDSLGTVDKLLIDKAPWLKASDK